MTKTMTPEQRHRCIAHIKDSLVCHLGGINEN